jgi:choline/glycine/proline betaine transport protein
LSKLNRIVFLGASSIILLLMVITILQPEAAEITFQKTQSIIVTNGSWFYVLTVAIILTFVTYLAFSEYGSIKLGADHSTPEYGFVSWLAMLFAAGMGIGLMFYGVAEPLMHFASPPLADGGDLSAVKQAMQITFFHWGLHAWAIYTVVGLILSYYCYRKNLPLTLSSSLFPFIGKGIYGWRGHVVDIFAVVSTVFGVATSLGLGSSQINSGLNYLFGLEVSITNQVILMLSIICIASISIASGLDRGIKILSETNLVLAILLMILIFALGSSVYLIQAYVQNIGAYLSDLVRITFNLFAYEKTTWIGGWTIFYWGWWLAWAPFVGLFIARISKGRTIREFIVGVMLVPTAFTLLWMTIFGNSAIDLVFTQGVDRLSDMVSQDSSVALFVFLENYPMSSALTVLSLVMIVVFFVTSCDSGAMVIDMLCSHGNNNTPLWQRLYWTFGIGFVAAGLSLAGGLQALQTMTIVSALPFAIILLIAMAGLLKSLRVESAKRLSLQMNMAPHPLAETHEDWRERLGHILEYPSLTVVEHFIDTKVSNAMEKLQVAFQERHLNASITKLNNGLQFRVDLESEQDFIYQIIINTFKQPEFSHSDASASAEDNDEYCRAEVHLEEGGQDYDIMSWSRNGITNDIIDQYHKHVHFLHLVR